MKMNYLIFFLILYFKIHCLSYNNKNNIDNKFLLYTNKDSEIIQYTYNKNKNNNNTNNNSNKTIKNKSPFQKNKEKLKVNKNPIFISKLRHKLIDEISDSDILKTYNIINNENSHKFKLNKNNPQNYLFNINDIETKIKISRDYTYGIIKDKIKFELPRGYHNKIVHKISLGGTNNNLHSFRVSSR
jgi:hypothetical protein